MMVTTKTDNDDAKKKNRPVVGLPGPFHRQLP